VATDPKELVLRYVDKVVLAGVLLWLLWSAYSNFFAGGQKSEDPSQVIKVAAGKIMRHLQTNKAEKPVAPPAAEELLKRIDRKVARSTIRPWIFYPPTPKTMPDVKVQIGQKTEISFPKPLVSVGRSKKPLVVVTQSKKDKSKVIVAATIKKEAGETTFSVYDIDQRRYDVKVIVVEKIGIGAVRPPVDLNAEPEKGLIRLSWKTNGKQTSDVKITECRVYRLSSVETARGEQPKLVHTTQTNPGQFQKTPNRTFVPRAFEWEDRNIEPDETYRYWVSIFAKDLPKPESDLAGPVEVRSVSDIEIRVVLGAQDRATLLVRKFHEGVWREKKFVVAVGGFIGQRDVLRTRDAEGRLKRIFVDWSTHATLVDVILNAPYLYFRQKKIPVFDKTRGEVVDYKKIEVAHVRPLTKVIYVDRRGNPRELWQQWRPRTGEGIVPRRVVPPTKTQKKKPPAQKPGEIPEPPPA